MLKKTLEFIFIRIQPSYRKEVVLKQKLLLKLLEIVFGSLITINVTINNFNIEKE